MKPLKKLNRKVRNQNSPRVSPKKSSDILVTKEMLNEVRFELKHEITEVRIEMRAGFKGVDAKFKRVDASFLDLKSDIQMVQADIQKVLAAVHGVKVDVEEQKARNTFVLDGYANLHDRVTKLESEKAR